MNSIKIMVASFGFKMTMTMMILWKELDKTNGGKFPLKIAMGKEAVSLKWCTFRAVLLFDDDSDNDGEVEGVVYSNRMIIDTSNRARWHQKMSTNTL